MRIASLPRIWLKWFDIPVLPAQHQKVSFIKAIHSIVICLTEIKFVDYIPWKINNIFSFRPISMNQNEDGTVYSYWFTHTNFNLVEYNTMFRYVFMALAEFLMKAKGYVRYVSQDWHFVHKHISAFQHKIIVTWGLHVYFVAVLITTATK